MRFPTPPFANKSLSVQNRISDLFKTTIMAFKKFFWRLHEIENKNQKPLRIVLGLFILILPFLIKNLYYMRIINMILIYSILTIGLNLVVGHTGVLSFGHAAFYGIGAYTTAILMKYFGWSFWIVLPLSGIIASLFGILLGLPSFRVRGDYLCVVTIGFGEIIRLVMQNWTGLTRGPMGIPGIPSPKILGVNLTSHTQFYYLGLALLLLTCWIIKNLYDSKIGRALLSIRNDELVASVMGINTFFYKILSLVIATFFAGLAGSFLAVYLSFVGPLNFTMDESVLLIIMVIWGGMGSLKGSIFGAATMLGIVELVRPIYQFRTLIWGAVLLIVLLVRPQGVFPRRIYKPYRETATPKDAQ